MLKNKNLIILTALFMLFNVKNVHADNIECKKESNKITCDYEISTKNKNASDIGTYNINLNLIKIKKVNGIINGNMTISANLCENDLQVRINEKIQIAQSAKKQGYNFPLYLHKKVIVANFCIKVVIDNCIDSCGDLIRLEGNISPIMIMEKRS
jgi:hypothetical protein